jgi:energy-coupling factor transporter ATP-binding protein EcfA2
MGAAAGGCHPGWRAADWQALVQGLGLDEHRHKEMFRLSTGGKRKVLLAAALASGAPLTLIDEPEAALDGPSIRHLRQALAAEARRCRESGRVIVVANYEAVPDVPWGRCCAWRDGARLHGMPRRSGLKR